MFVLTGYFEEKLIKKKSFNNLLKEISLKDKKVDGSLYLHGYCDLFVMKLFEFAKKHNENYYIYVIVDDENGPIHSFCGYTRDEEYFIDIRGITNEIPYFFKEFEDFFDYKTYFDDGDCEGTLEVFHSIEEYLEFMKTQYDDFDWYFSQEEFLSESEEILETYKNYYLISEHLK